MSKLLEFLLGSILMTILAVALIVFSALHYILRLGGIADAGCAWHSSAKTWVDFNGDGIVNKGEPPLSEVEIHIDDVQNQLVDVGWPTISDKNGEARLNVLIPGCSNVLFEVYANTPQGYRMTTKPRIEVNPGFLGSLATEKIYYFGFISDQ
ncbi:MAG: SdrD B-like domain-containing protein [Anaerolineales bacterium]